ncbi:proteasome core particle subunit beta 3 [Spiromyces aspiralis]|uniref:Proteasome core particle subunit beta 3 n=1 Tax=Spiromyces aspiralis TaxID=68401 RepID=A0ACC1HHQ1_9FUNG|nr:proteasome core particle subunit beta 3 [Spiromyces aspiralis]
MSITEYNGAAVLAMVGKDCVVIGCDKRLGERALTVSTDFEKVFKVRDKLFVGLPGLATDVKTLHDRIRYRVNIYEMEEERPMQPKVLANMISSMLYQKRFGPYFIEPIIAGIDENNKPYIASMDLIGCILTAKDFVVGGTASDNLYGMCEALWEPDMGPDDLFRLASQALVNAVDRDAMSGWGAVVHVITPEKHETYHVQMRQD